MSCKYNFMYHIILVTKYRKRLLITYGDFIKECVEEISLKYKFNRVSNASEETIKGYIKNQG